MFPSYKIFYCYFWIYYHISSNQRCNPNRNDFPKNIRINNQIDILNISFSFDMTKIEMSDLVYHLKKYAFVLPVIRFGYFKRKYKQENERYYFSLHESKTNYQILYNTSWHNEVKYTPEYLVQNFKFSYSYQSIWNSNKTILINELEFCYLNIITQFCKSYSSSLFNRNDNASHIMNLIEISQIDNECDQQIHLIDSEKLYHSWNLLFSKFSFLFFSLVIIFSFDALHCKIIR